MITKRLSEHLYGENHPFIGMPCLFKNKPAIPYGCYTRKDEEIFEDDDGVRLVILYYDRDEPAEGKNVFVKALANIRPNDEQLVVLDPKDHRFQKVQHIILAWLADNRYGTFRPEQKS